MSGTVTLGGTLASTFGFTPQAGNTLPFIGNDAVDAVSGAFANQPPGSVLAGVGVEMSHALGDGNDAGFFVPDSLFRNGFED